MNSLAKILGGGVMVAAGLLGKCAAAQNPECPVSVVGEAVKAMIAKEALDQGADAKLSVLVGQRESRLGENVNSPAGARGIMQLMPETAARYGVKDICDPQQNIRGGVAFLADLMKKYDRNIMLTLAAYNAGEQRVLKARGIPALGETVGYVAAITNDYYDLKNSFSTANATAKPSVSLSENKPNVTENKLGQHWIGGTVLILDGD